MQEPCAQQSLQTREPRARHRGRQTKFASSRRNIVQERRAHEQCDVEQIEPFALSQRWGSGHYSENQEDVSVIMMVFE
jgi:hypothetical protein